MATRMSDWLGADVGYETDNRFPTKRLITSTTHHITQLALLTA